MSALHQTWADQWAPALMDDTLRTALLGQDRFAARIEQDLLDDVLNCPAELDVLERETADIAATAASFDDELVLSAGLYWCAPVLPKSLQPLRDLPDVDVTRNRLRMVMAGRTHHASSHVRVPKNAEDLRDAGERCLAVWLRFLPDLKSLRVSLRFNSKIARLHTDPLADGVRYSAIQTALDVCQGPTE